MNVFNAKLGEILINAGVISNEQLAQALAHQKQTRQRLGDQLMTSGFITEQQLCRALRDQLHLKYIDLTTMKVKPEVAALVPEAMASSANMLPFNRINNTLCLAVSDPMDYNSVRNIEIHTGLNADIYICEKSKVADKIHELYTTQKVFDAARDLQGTQTVKEDTSIIVSQEDDQPIIRFINNMLEQAVLMKASDIHIEPSEENMRVRFRVDGSLTDYIITGIELFPAVCSRIKFIGGMSIAEKRVPQDGRATYNSGGHNIDLRISTLPGIFGEKIVIRITTSLGFDFDINELGFSSNNIEKLQKLLKKPFGIILLTGPTGSGKSTTLYAALGAIQNSEINIVTVENPVEVIVPGVTQVNINPAQGLTFPAVLRSVLRQDPDVVMIGEIRDGETAEIASSMSITGHLVFSTLHTFDAPSAIVRLVDMGIEPFMVASSVIGVISQRLLRQLCPECKEPHEASIEHKKLLKLDPEKSYTLYSAKGCPHCKGTGFQGRSIICEIMEVTNTLRDSINRVSSSDMLRKQAIMEGMIPISFNARSMVLKGLTSIEETLKYVDYSD